MIWASVKSLNRVPSYAQADATARQPSTENRSRNREHRSKRAPPSQRELQERSEIHLAVAESYEQDEYKGDLDNSVCAGAGCTGCGYFSTASDAEEPEKRRRKRKRRKRNSRKELENVVMTVEKKDSAVVELADERGSPTKVNTEDAIEIMSQSTVQQGVDLFEGEPEHREVFLLKHYILLVAAAIFCGYLLSIVESPKERKLKNRAYRRGQRIKRVLDDGIANNWFDEGFKKDVKQVCNFVSEEERDLIDFDITGSTFFVATVVTTIGYGTYTPQTPIGKLITCFVAIFGVAWFGYILTVAASRAENLVRYIVVLYRKGFGFARADVSKHDVVNVNRELFTPGQVLFRVFCLNLAYIVCLATLGFASHLITPGNAFYMSIITFSTVGLGDVAPPFFNEPGVPYRQRATEVLGLTLIALVGLTLLALLFNSVEVYSKYRYELLVSSRGDVKAEAEPRTSSSNDQNRNKRVTRLGSMHFGRN